MAFVFAVTRLGRIKIIEPIDHRPIVFQYGRDREIDLATLERLLGECGVELPAKPKDDAAD